MLNNLPNTWIKQTKIVFFFLIKSLKTKIKYLKANKCCKKNIYIPATKYKILKDKNKS